ncbi:glycoside hydrolase N-terminal domain-containing protein [candidate division KSB1 bacterium]
MKNRKLKQHLVLYLYFSAFLICFILSCSEGNNKIPLYDNIKLKLMYLQPADKWTKALPVGNGRIGAMVFGRVNKERIQVNEESLWAGSRINNNNPEALKSLPVIQKLLLEEKNSQAQELVAKTFLGTPPRIRSYQTAGDIFIEADSSAVAENYKRELLLESGICRISYELNSVKFIREVFASAPDNIIVVYLASEKPGSINASVSLRRDKDAEVFVENNQLVMKGQIADEPDELRGPEGEHMKFASRLTVLNDGGEVTGKDNKIFLKDVNSSILIYTAATDYNLSILNFDRSIDPDKICSEIIEKARRKTYSELKTRHINDHRKLFNRVKLDLGQDEYSDLPTDKRLEALRAGQEDQALIALYFQYGRYLLMGSSRFPGRLPANLQGIWNEHFNAPWNSDFHTNINLQMNYWPAEVCNLPETVIPLTDFFDKLRVPGRITAKEMYGARGWTMHHLTDVFGRTGVADGPWGVTPLNGPWMTFPLWRHFEFTGDEDYLKEKAYPVMKESALFILDFLIEDNEGNLVTAPSHSPENLFILPNGERSTLTYAATIDLQIISALFENCIKASEILGIDQDFREELSAVLKKLPPVKIGKDGTIQEWIKDYKEGAPGHRHMSHLAGLHPANQITPATPELFEAAKKTIEKRLSHGGGHTGWSRAWIVNFYARLLDGDKAYENISGLLRKSTLPNLFDDHPPFQIDGNFGGTAGIAEMLVQSHTGEIHLLPALPSAWKEGSINGICARGGFVLDISWDEGNLTGVNIFSKLGKDCRIRYGNHVKALKTEKGKSIILDRNLQ